MRQMNFFTCVLFVSLMVGTTLSLSSCEKIKDLIEGEEPQELDLTDNEAVTQVLNGGIWYKYPDHAYLFRKDRVAVLAWYNFEEDPTDPGDTPVGTNVHPHWEVEDGYLYLDEDHSGYARLEDLFDYQNGIHALRRMYDPVADKGTLELPPLTGKVWNGNYFEEGMEGTIYTSLQFFEDGTALRVDSIYAGFYEIGDIQKYEYRWEVSDNNVIHLTGGEGGYGVALPDDPHMEAGEKKAIFMDFHQLSSPFANF